MNNNRQALIIKYIIPNTMLCVCVCKYIISNLWCKETRKRLETFNLEPNILLSPIYSYLPITPRLILFFKLYHSTNW